MDDQVSLPFEDFIDLHPFSPKEVSAVVLEYLEMARENHCRQVRLIHGRGIGAQREMIRTLLSRLPFIEAFHDADPSGGGWGATVVLLRDAPPLCDT